MPVIEYKVVTDRVPEIEFSGDRNQPKNGFRGELNKVFLHFLPKFLAYLMINYSKFYYILGARSTLKNHQILQKK